MLPSTVFLFTLRPATARTRPLQPKRFTYHNLLSYDVISLHAEGQTVTRKKSSDPKVAQTHLCQSELRNMNESIDIDAQF